MSNTLLERIKIRLKQFHTVSETDADGNMSAEIVFDDLEENPLLEELIADAWKDVKQYRQYPTYFSEDKVSEDLKQYEHIVIKLVIYDYNKVGADFESQNSENDMVRTYEKRQSILADIVPLVTLLSEE